RDEVTHALCLQVVGVVVADGKRVGTQHDTALNLRTEALRTAQAHDLIGAAGAIVAGAQAVTHPVKAGEGRGALRKLDQVVGVQRVDEVRAADLHELRALGLQLLHVGLVALTHARLQGFCLLELLDDTNLQALEVAVSPLLGSCDDIGDLVAGRRGVVLIEARDDLVQAGCVLDRAGRRAALIQGGSAGDKAVAGNGAVGRLHAHSVGQRGRLADGTTRVRTDSQRSHARSQRRGGATAGTARGAFQIPRVTGRAVSGVL